jgi:rubrerythrin
MDLPNYPALICVRCIEDLSRAIIFRNRCKSADQFLKKSLNYFDKSGWSNELNSLQETLSFNEFGVKNEQDVLKTIKSEPPEVESFFEYPTISAEAILNENSEENDWLNENQEDDNESYSRKRKKQSDMLFTCEVCGKTFELKSKYNRHYRTKHIGSREKKEIINGCHYCMKIFDSRTQLKDHIRYKHEVHDFYCDVSEIFYSFNFILHFSFFSTAERISQLRTS